MQSAIRLAATLSLTACASRQNVTTEEPRAVVAVNRQAADTTSRSTLIYRTTSYPDPELAARGLGRLEIVVRVADRPAQTVAQAQVLIRSGEQAADKRLLADQRGVVQFDSIAVGRYRIVVRAIGYGSATFEAPVSPGCRTDVEVYIGLAAMGIAPPPPEPGRSTVTTCRPER